MPSENTQISIEIIPICFSFILYLILSTSQCHICTTRDAIVNHLKTSKDIDSDIIRNFRANGNMVSIGFVPGIK